MIRVLFKNVGQGDSIILEWSVSNKKSIGIIDSNIYENQNPILEYLLENNIKEIEFIILSHFHYDHFSGIPAIFKHCHDKRIKIKYFFHTFASHVLHIYNRIFTSKKLEKSVKDFFDQLEQVMDTQIDNVVQVDSFTNPIQLSNSETLSFLAPTGKIYLKIAKNISRKSNDIIVSYPDINKLATITCISNDKDFILLTSDAIRQSFRFINKRIIKQLLAIQVPHHGSYKNIYPPFWESVNKKDQCPAVFSVGDEPKDKLPDKETVTFIDKNGFDIHSTNLVYGLSDHYEIAQNYISNQKIICLDMFSFKRGTTEKNNLSQDKYSGDKSFDFFEN